MSEKATTLNPAQEASEKALAEVYHSLARGQSFLLEAGAGAGKTYSLVKALQFLIKRDQYTLPRRHQKIACITFTNVAKDEIEARTDRSPLIFCDTIHAFCWSLISGFQRQMRERLPQMEHWAERIAESHGLGDGVVEYTLGHRKIKDGRISIHHDDVICLTICLMESPKFRQIITNKYPLILIDEYQDTNVAWIDSIKRHYLGQSGAPRFGFFGDHWQKIYEYGCGKIEHPDLKTIPKQANFRSVIAIVECLNRIRPELPQFVEDPNETGYVRIFHSNAWNGTRQTSPHWKGDLPNDVADKALQIVMQRLQSEGWDFSPAHTKILMLTHRALAGKQGYGTLPSVFAYNESFTKKENPHIAFFADALEPACEAFLARKYGDMFLALGGKIPAIRCQADKKKWTTAMNRLIELRETGTVGNVIDHLRHARRPRLPDVVDRREQELQAFDRNSGAEIPDSLKELESLRSVSYQEIIALCRYLAGHSPFETKHGVKGAEFENVLVVIGRGWNRYNFSEMLELAQDAASVPKNKQEAFERNRNLFYVTCSRPQKRLAVLFTQELSNGAIATLKNWFGEDSLEPLVLEKT